MSNLSRKRQCSTKFERLNESLRRRLGNSVACAFPNNLDSSFSKYRKPPLKTKNEYHIPGYNFCGPGTQVEARLRRGDKGVNKLDNACRVHDVEYMVHNDSPEALRDSDKKLAYVADQISAEIDREIEENPTMVSSFLSKIGLSSFGKGLDYIYNNDKLYHKVAADAVGGVFKGKRFLEDVKLVDPMGFAKGLEDKNTDPNETRRKGIDLYKKFILHTY
jgi:hypothetical protein